MQATNRSGQTAGTLILIGLILQIIEVVILVAVGAFLLLVPFLGVLVLFLGGIGVVWVVLVWLFSYQRTQEGDYSGARTPTLVFAILSLITVGLISGILYLIAYVKLGDAMERGSPNFAWGAAPQPPGTQGGRFCSRCGAANASTASFCARCGAQF